jgi:hypothetical protein
MEQFILFGIFTVQQNLQNAESGKRAFKAYLDYEDIGYECLREY